MALFEGKYPGDGIVKLFQKRIPWPQTQPPTTELIYRYPNHRTRGFLPPLLIPPVIETIGDEESSDPKAANKIGKKFGQYIYTDWRGQILNLLENTGLGVGETREKFEQSIDLPKNAEGVKNSPHSTRDFYLIFGDTSQDYFKHGLQIVDEINRTPSKEFWETQKNKELASRATISNFKGTPYENNDPVMFGFDIIFDDVSSPLLNGSISDFLELFGPAVSEINARIPIYEEFKQQFIKFFKTKASVKINDEITKMTIGGGRGYPNAENTTKLYSSGRKAYMNYYLKKITGLSKLIEFNTASEKNFLVDYNKDVITLSFSEDVSLSIGTLAHLYKLLYWSRPNAKTIIPENLLRFNCDIIISEVRNYNRVKKSIKTGDIEVVKDNVSRYIYSLRECQFYFNTLPHEDAIDLGAIKTFESYDIQFDFKYSTVKFEKFIPNIETGLDGYVGYDGGAIWKVGNAGNRGSSASRYGKSTPNFYTIGQNKFNQNGVSRPFAPYIVSYPGKTTTDFIAETEEQNFDSFDSTLDDLQKKSKLVRRIADKALENSIKLGKSLANSLSGELQTAINTRVSLLNKSLNKILESSGIDGMTPPRNIYTSGNLDLKSRLFYDVRGELLNFVGSTLGGTLLGDQNLGAGAGGGGSIVIPPRPPKYNPFTQNSKTAQELYGTSDFSKIGFPNSAQKFPPPNQLKFGKGAFGNNFGPG